jgi:hypothetical protein
LLVNKELLNDEQLKLIELLKINKKEGGILTGGKSALHAFLLAVETQTKTGRGPGLVVCPNDKDYDRQIANVTDAWKDLFGETDSFPLIFCSIQDLKSKYLGRLCKRLGDFNAMVRFFRSSIIDNNDDKYTEGFKILKKSNNLDFTKPYPCAKDPVDYPEVGEEMNTYCNRWKWVLFLSNHNSPIHFKELSEFYLLKLICSERKWVIVNQEQHIYQQLHYLLSASGLRWCKDLDDEEFESLNTSKYHSCGRMEKTMKTNLKKQYIIDVPDYSSSSSSSGNLIINNNNKNNNNNNNNRTKSTKSKTSRKTSSFSSSFTPTKFTMNESIEHFECTYRRSPRWYEDVVRMFNAPSKSNMKINRTLARKYIKKAYSDDTHVRVIESLVTNKTSEEKRFSPDNTLLLTSSDLIYNKFSKSFSGKKIKLGFLNKFHVVHTTNQKKLPVVIKQFLKRCVKRVIICDAFALGIHRFNEVRRWFSKESYSSSNKIIFTWVLVDHIIDHSFKKQLVDSNGKSINFVSVFNNYKKFDNYTIPISDNYDRINTFSAKKLSSSSSSSSSSSNQRSSKYREQLIVNLNIVDEESKINDNDPQEWNASFNSLRYHLLTDFENTGFFEPSNVINDINDIHFNMIVQMKNGKIYITPKRRFPALLIEDLTAVSNQSKNEFLLDNIYQQEQITPKIWNLVADETIAKSYAALTYPKNLKKRLRTEKEIEKVMNNSKKQRIIRDLQSTIAQRKKLELKFKKIGERSNLAPQYFENNLKSIELVIHSNSNQSSEERIVVLDQDTMLFAMNEFAISKPENVFDLSMQQYFAEFITELDDDPEWNTCVLLCCVFGYECDLKPYNSDRGEFCIIYQDGLLAYSCDTPQTGIKNELESQIIRLFCKKTQYLKYAPQRSHKHIKSIIDNWFKRNIPNTNDYGEVHKDDKGFYQYDLITSPYYKNWYSVRVEPIIYD